MKIIKTTHYRNHEEHWIVFAEGLSKNAYWVIDMF